MNAWTMNRRSVVGLLAFVAAILFALVRSVSAEEKPVDPAGEQKDIEAVKRFLTATHPGKSWSDGPTRQKNDAIGTAYPDSRFYCVFTRPMGASRSDMIDAMVRFDKDGSASEVGEGKRVAGKYGPDPQSFNAGLMKVAKAEDAKVAGAAIMSLLIGPYGPYSVAAGDVQVTPAGEEKDPKGYTCKATTGREERGRKVNVFEVRFDADGKCTSASYKYLGSLPRCQSTRLLDENPIMRPLAEQDLLAMGPVAKTYLDTMRPKLSADLQRAIDDIWQRIEKGERPSGPRYYGQARLLTHADPLVRSIVEQNLRLLGSEIIADLKKERDVATGDLKRAIDDLLVIIAERKEK